MTDFQPITDDWQPEESSFKYLLLACPGITDVKLHIFRLNYIDLCNEKRREPESTGQAFIDFVNYYWSDQEDTDPSLVNPRELVVITEPESELKREMTQTERELCDRSWAYKPSVNNGTKQYPFLVHPKNKARFPDRTLEDLFGNVSGKTEH